MVREAVGLAAYAAGDWTTAIAELRTYHRMTGRQTHLAELADCERALGRPERAIDLFRGADKDTLDKAGAIELLIVAAGARGDLGQHDAAVAMLQVKELTTDADADWAARLRYAYADALLAAGRREEAREWFSRAAAADEDGLTDAAERLLELDGISIEGDDDEDDDEGTSEAPTDADARAEADDDRDDFDDERDDDFDDERDENNARNADARDDDARDEDDARGRDEDGDDRADADGVPGNAFLDDDESDDDSDDDDDLDDLDQDVDAGIDEDDDRAVKGDDADDDELTGSGVGGTDADLAATDPATRGTGAKGTKA